MSDTFLRHMGLDPKKQWCETCLSYLRLDVLLQPLLQAAGVPAERTVVREASGWWESFVRYDHERSRPVTKRTPLCRVHLEARTRSDVR